MKKQNSVSKDNTFWEIQYGHKPTLFPAIFHIYAGSEEEAREAMKDRWHGTRLNRSTPLDSRKRTYP